MYYDHGNVELSMLDLEDIYASCLLTIFISIYYMLSLIKTWTGYIGNERIKQVGTCLRAV
jgi:hypothetical protein